MNLVSTILRFIARFAALILTVLLVVVASSFGFIMYQFYTAPAGDAWFNLALLVLVPLFLLALLPIIFLRKTACWLGRKPEV